MSQMFVLSREKTEIAEMRKYTMPAQPQQSAIEIERGDFWGSKECLRLRIC